MALDFERIKQRKIVQWAVAYLAAAVGVVQVLDVLANQFDWSHSIMRAITIVLAIGFFAVLVLAWYHGERGIQRVTGLEALVLASLVLIAGASVAMFARSSKSTKVATLDSSIADASVAVLPFKNFSSDKEQEYFSDGITEEILNALAQIDGLKVAARTSSFAFKDKDVPVDEIAARLHVSNVLEGSVQRAGDKVRITAQLINARTGYHIWSQTFDRPAQDVFAVQDEISRDVAQALQLRLTKATTATARTISPEAHNEYLLGLYHWNKRTSSDLIAALQHFQRASQLQPDYAAAYAGEANTWAVVPTWVDTMTGVFALPKAKVAAERALALDPNLPDAYAALGGYYQWYEYNFAKARSSVSESSIL
jgi:TolB-like protein